MIGHALLHVVPVQLQTWAAIIYDLCTIDKILANKKTTDGFYFMQRLKWSNKNKIYNFFLPQIKAPLSIVYFWIKQFGLYDRVKIPKTGFSNLQEICAELRGWYDFYIHERYISLMFN